MAIYSYIKINTGSPFGAELNPVKFNYTIIGEFEGRTYINTDDEAITEQNALIDFKLETENPIQKQKELEETIKQSEESVSNTLNKINKIKDEFLTAVLLNDYDTQDTLKAEYKKLLEEL